MTWAAIPVQEAAEHPTGHWDRRAQAWRRHLADVPTLLELPSDRPRPRDHDASGLRVPVGLGQAVAQSVAQRADWLGITPLAFLLGAFGLTLSRWTSARRLLVGVPLTEGDAPGPGAGAGNLVPVRIAIDDDLTAADFLRSVHHALLFSIEAGDLPFDELVARLAIEQPADRHPLVQVCLGMDEQLAPEQLAPEQLSPELDVRAGRSRAARLRGVPERPVERR
jgi:non-ribosomal peptide synthetase component F